MFKSYLTIAVRSLLKRKGYSAINIIGLGAGLAAVIVILLFAQQELSYDRFHERADDVYQVYKERVTPTGTQVTRDTWAPLGERLEREYPAVEESVRMWTTTEWVRIGDRRFQEDVTYTDPSLFASFTFPLAAGDPASALSQPTSVVISSEAAARYFGDRDPIGEALRIDNVGEYVVSGVLQEIPRNSSIEIDLAVPIESAPFYDDIVDEWDGSFLFTYVLLDEGADPSKLEAQFPALVRNIWDDEVASRTNMRLEPLPELYNALTGNRRYAYIMLGVALIILVIGAINFINLATARSLERAREIGMRKVLGARRRQLVQQFIGEATVLSLAALSLAVFVVKLMLPLINDVYGLQLELTLGSAPIIPIALLLFGVGVGLLAGAYPALFISRFGPIASLRGGVTSGDASGTRLRHALVVTQFALAVALIAGTLVMRDQIHYMQSAELKFDSENVIVVNVGVSDFEDRDDAARRLDTFKAELARTSSITAIASSSHAPGRWRGWFTFAIPEGWGDEDPLRMRVAFVDDDYFDAYGISFVEGRPFDRDRPTDDQASVIVNEAALSAFGWEHPEGRTVRRGDQDFTVIGVVRDYHFSSLRDEIAPVLHFYRQPDNGVHNFVAARVEPGREEQALAAIASAWRQVDPERALPYEFADRTFAQLYERDQQLAAVVGTFTMLAILIACLGLFGLASWSVTQRLKEVGIRRVLGASATAIVLLLSRDFMRLVLVALIVAVPIGYVAMSEWLADFAYRVPIGASAFVLAGGAAAVIAFVTVSVLATRAALIDPVRTLRYE